MFEDRIKELELEIKVRVVEYFNLLVKKEAHKNMSRVSWPAISREVTIAENARLALSKFLQEINLFDKGH